jgi:NDP-sugar pyrophosphorylase family protein
VIPRRALVLAAGLGSRLRALAGDLPKPLVPVAGAPIIAHTLRWLAESGVEDVFVNLNYQPLMVRHALGDGAAFGLRIAYLQEPQLLGTAGALANVPDDGEPLLVVYGDSLVRLDLAELAACHRRAGAEATIALFDQTRHPHTGVAGGRVRTDAAGRVVAFVEGGEAETSSLVNAGVYLLEPAVAALARARAPGDFGRDVFPTMLAEGRRLGAYLIGDEGYCLGMDTPQSFAAGEALLAEGRVALT